MAQILPEKYICWKFFLNEFRQIIQALNFLDSVKIAI